MFSVCALHGSRGDSERASLLNRSSERPCWQNRTRSHFTSSLPPPVQQLELCPCNYFLNCRRMPFHPNVLCLEKERPIFVTLARLLFTQTWRRLIQRTWEYLSYTPTVKPVSLSCLSVSKSTGLCSCPEAGNTPHSLWGSLAVWKAKNMMINQQLLDKKSLGTSLPAFCYLTASKRL